MEGSARGTGGSGNGAALKDGRRRRDAASARGSSLADTTAFEALYSDHRRELYGLCRSILRNDHDAQDALQSAFVRALAALRRDLEVAEARPWLYRIARNEAISILRRRSAAPEGDAAENVAAPPEAEVVRREELRELRGDLARLSERQRTVLLLRAVNGLGHNEIAVRTGSSPAAVKHSIAEARRALADCRLGREMPCADARALLATGDRRMWRRRRLRAHVRACEACRDELPRRERTRWLAALVGPLAPARLLAALHDAGALATSATGSGAAARALVIAVTVAGTAAAVHEQGSFVTSPARAANPSRVAAAPRGAAPGATASARGTRQPGTAAGSGEPAPTPVAAAKRPAGHGPAVHGVRASGRGRQAASPAARGVHRAIGHSGDAPAGVKAPARGVKAPAGGATQPVRGKATRNRRRPHAASPARGGKPQTTAPPPGHRAHVSTAPHDRPPAKAAG